MDTLEWGYNDEELHDIDEFDLEQYGFQYDTQFSSNGFANYHAFGDGTPLQATEAFVAPYYVKMEPQPQTNYFDPYAHVQIKEEPLYTYSLPQQQMSTFIPKTEPARIKHLSGDEIDIQIDGQPPGEVRTRTPSETRTFTVTAKILGNYKKMGASIMKIALLYDKNDMAEAEPVKKDILGGTKTVPVLNDGTVIFDTLTISESSTKHKEREFCLELTLLRNDGHELLKRRTRSFYAYSHKKVLQRRGSVKLRTLSKGWGKISGGDAMHVIGSPFIQGPALSLIVRTPHGDVTAKPLEYYSDSVLFFELPPYPLPEGLLITPDTEFKVQILVSNDGRTLSNPLDFIYIADNGSFRSRI
jgi:hypothetical protein